MYPEISDEAAMLIMGMGILSIWKIIDIAIWIHGHIDVSVSFK